VEIDSLIAKAQALGPAEAADHISFLEFAKSVFQPECVGIRLRAFQKSDGAVRVLCIWSDKGTLSDVEVHWARPDQLRWLIRRVSTAGLFVGAFASDRRKAQNCVDQAGVDMRVRAPPPKYGRVNAPLAAVR
jgi:hypothetical protein